MQGGEGEREAPGEWEADGGGAGAGPSSLAVARGSAGRKGAGAAAAGGPRARPGAEASLQRQQQQQRRIIRWERFLPRRSLRVLLVEQDDSTRHIVTALLRKCSYHVAAVVDGLKAWDVLKEKNYTFDLVLCEVEVPSLSGISLLCKIMANELSRNIPVIMTSSHDSVSVVFRCMQKGAVDFLVKPVRKNELRNLWQHVWRRHCSTSFTNGPENMPNNQTVSESMSDNNAASNDVSANAGKGSKSGESCDGGDDQCSGSKPLMQNESLKKQVAALPVDDRNSARVMKSQSQQLGDDVATLANAPKNHDNEKAKDTSVGIEVTLSVQETAMSDKVQEQLHFYDKSLCTQQDLCYARGKECTDNDYRPFWQNVVPHKSPEGTIDFIGSVINGQCSLSAMDNDSERKAALCEVRRSSDTINTCNADSFPSWELSLTRPQLNGRVKNGLHEKNTLNHSAASAFSRYAYTGICLPDRKSGTSSATISVRTREHADKFQSQFNSHDTANEKPSPFVPDGRLESPQRNKEEAVVYQVIPSSNDENAEHLALVPTSEDICIGYSVPRNSAAFPHSQLGMMPLPIPVGAMPFQSFCSGYGPILQPMFYHEPTVSPAAIEQAKCLTSSNQPADHGNHVNADIQSTAFHSCEEDHHPCPLELRRKSSTADVEQSDPRRPRLHICGTEEHTDQGGSYNRDIINGGGSNGNIGTADTAVNMRLAFEHGDESGLQNYRGKGVDPHCSHREAALIKFRLKRKDRCFEKKVRYHSRKMLAEQRPRVKGQFVRQAIIDSNTAATEVDD